MSAVNSVVNSIMPDYSAVLDQVQTITQQNNATAQANAQAQWDFNREEAQKSRDWTEYMSNSAHQREVKDLQAAGLNPVLSATGGSGAAVSSGATASGSSATNDTSANSLLGSYLASLINSATAINQSTISAKSAEAVADKYTFMDYKIKQDFPGLDNVIGGLVEGAIEGLGLGSSAKDTSQSVVRSVRDGLKNWIDNQAVKKAESNNKNKNIKTNKSVEDYIPDITLDIY